MLDPITALILKTLVSACVKFYLSSLLGAGQVTYKSAELGYKIPKWYMNPGRVTRTFYAYGTSVDGDEFQSIEDAHLKAIEQMAQHIRLGNRTMIEKQVHYDATSVKQRRLIELFVRGEGLETFIRSNAKMDKKQLVKVQAPPDIRAFVRLEMDAKVYLAYQDKTLNELKTRLMQQKTEDIMDEMQAEIDAWNKEAAELPEGMPAGIKPGDIAPPAMPDVGALESELESGSGAEVAPDDALEPAPAPAPIPTPPVRKKPAAPGGPFGDLEQELEESR